MTRLTLFLPCAGGVEDFLADEVHGLTGLRPRGPSIIQGVAQDQTRHPLLAGGHARRGLGVELALQGQGRLVQAFSQPQAGLRALVRGRRDGGDDGDMAVAGEMGGDFREAADMFAALFR